MIKQLAVSFIDIYQIVFSTFLKNLLGSAKFCRFEETCSAFTKRSIEQQGLFKGSYVGLIRILKCQPFYNFK